MIQLRHIATDFLAEGERCSIHQMSTADLHDTHILFRLSIKCIPEFFDTGNRHFHQRFVCCNVHSGRERIIGRLRLVYIIVRMYRFLLIHEASTLNHMCAISHYLIYIHITLRAGAGLPHNEWKLIIQFTFQNFITNTTYQFTFLSRKNACLHIGNRCCFLQISKSADNLLGHLVDVLGNFEILNRTLRLRAPIYVGRYLHRSHRILFNSEV